MTSKRSPKGQLGPLDHEVLRATRWTWWQQAYHYVQNGTEYNLPHCRVSIDAATRTLVNSGSQTFTSTWDHRAKVAYRMKRLEKHGYLKGSGYQGYSLTSAADPHVGTLISDAETRQKQEQLLIERQMDTINAKLAKVIPGNSFSVRNYGWGRTGKRGIEGHQVTSTMLSSHLLLLLELAEKYLEIIDKQYDDLE